MIGRLAIATIVALIAAEDEKAHDHRHLYTSQAESYCYSGQHACPSYVEANRTCWGYEKNCRKAKRFSQPHCEPPAKPWASNMEEKVERFFDSADFGWVKTIRSEMTTYCKSKGVGGSSLRCGDLLRHCRAINIYFDLRAISFENSRQRFRENVFGDGQVGGDCELDRDALAKQGAHRSALQSWYGELERYTSLPFRPNSLEHCDVILDKRPVIFVKLDAGINMFHHFCDFVNLYVSQHINGTFSTDVDIIMWDTSEMGYGDFFEVTWQAFTRHSPRPIPLSQYKNKRLCIRDALFPLLPRMRLGLYYNMPVVRGCSRSGLFKAFCDHVLRRLDVKQEGPSPLTRVTLLSRGTKFRRILNQDELVSALKTVGEYNVTVVDYDWRTVPFLRQLEITHNSDVFIGMHGAGLAHALFLPDWATLFELYNCEDPNCYNDLSRLRGVNYLTWERRDKMIQQDPGKHPQTGEPHAKFTNYSFDVEEFLRMVDKAVRLVKDRLGRD
ncbi:EGF domain-specific O-linked N-acetylglucosamine transferase-like [Oscarella lobularis]|uniref:EGF domain-specific O-linked N-acetylglucosamine transferase-like n=1 Tax=Oscarella lobularis TaxID=121494 RepID=UPI00331341AB